MNNLSTLFGKNLKKIRKSQNISQRNFAEKADMSESSIIAIEKGQVGIQFETLEKLCAALDVPVAEFFNEKELSEQDLTAEKIKQAIKGLSAKELEIVYKLICGLKNT